MIDKRTGMAVPEEWQPDYCWTDEVQRYYRLETPDGWYAIYDGDGNVRGYTRDMNAPCTTPPPAPFLPTLPLAPTAGFRQAEEMEEEWRSEPARVDSSGMASPGSEGKDEYLWKPIWG